MIMKVIMDKKPARPPVRIVLKYFLLQLPGQVAFILILLLARQWLETPAYLIWGFALTHLNPDGYVQVKGERWQAGIYEKHASIKKGDAICVEAINGLELTVRSCTED